ncbi:MAG: lipoate--protein ligase family protein [Candidatus Saganbacteria bacterium]|nr:lipoate--protein ligase family protein [Candidatus Saganbacteria bacterium]
MDRQSLSEDITKYDPQWNVIIDEKRTAQENMDIDADLYKNSISPTLRIFGWKSPSITVGYFLDIDKEIDTDKAKEKGVDIAKRPTGGGIAFHSKDDISYTVVAPLEALPKGLMASYMYISNIIAKALFTLGIKAEIKKTSLKNRQKGSNICFLDPLEYEITVGGRKLVGSAQKRGRDRLIQQGTVAVNGIPDNTADLLKKKFSIEGYRASSTDLASLAVKDLAFRHLADVLSGAFFVKTVK